MNIDKFITDLVEGDLSDSTIIDFVKQQESKYSELLYTELGFLTGLVMCVDSGVNPTKVIERRIELLREKHQN